MVQEHPAQLAAMLEAAPTLPPGDAERFLGYGVMGAPFSSGDVLAMRRFAASSIGDPYTTVWHRTRSGDWTIYSDRDPHVTCPRYFGGELARAVETPISVSWPTADRMDIAVPAAAVIWTIELESTPTTRFLNALGRTMTDGMWRNGRVLATMSRMAARLLHAGKLGLSGHTPNGQTFTANPMRLWLIGASHAVIAGRDLGELAPLSEQAHLGEFWIPQRGLFAFGRAFFEPLDPSRHRTITQVVT